MTAPNHADHPHTDPGDGRSECDRCGKWVFPAIHSCKGVPVTAAARARFDAARQPFPAGKQSDGEPVTNAEQFDRPLMEIFHRAVVRALHELDVQRGRAYPDAPTDWHIDQATAVMEAALPALAGASRLLPPPADSRIEWGVWWHAETDGIRYSEEQFATRADAERRGPQMVGIHRITRFTLRHRSHREFKDGSMWVGPWVPVPTTPDGA